ncbi:MAG: hypothetical protein COA94_08560 [Rickettsiales bacterium]|nr:MAG: hypothetical protein COA94_08560 [Rickettsiales bacterium]
MNNATQDEIFNDIAAGIRKSSKTTMTEAESRQAARRLIEFCRIMIDVQRRIDNDKNDNNNKVS